MIRQGEAVELTSCAAFAAGPALAGLRIKVAVLLFNVNSAANKKFYGRKKTRTERVLDRPVLDSSCKKGAGARIAAVERLSSMLLADLHLCLGLLQSLANSWSFSRHCLELILIRGSSKKLAASVRLVGY